jgi:hypothetical protein
MGCAQAPQAAANKAALSTSLLPIFVKQNI